MRASRLAIMAKPAVNTATINRPSIKINFLFFGSAFSKQSDAGRATLVTKFCELILDHIKLQFCTLGAVIVFYVPSGYRYRGKPKTEPTWEGALNIPAEQPK